MKPLGVIVLILVQSVWAQYPQYPKDYFMFPIKPGKQNFLSGSMGELRPNHFHGGLDIKTDQKIGLPVYAAAEGYIYRIAVSSRGYGNTLYIRHPNGLITVYAHLQWFNGKIAKYITDLLYQNQCNEIDHVLLTDTFMLKKGDTIAFSGNSGSSGGPHLHWEIRDKDENMLNPLFFDFPEVVDNLPPYINKLAVRSMNIDGRVEGEFARIEYVPQKVPGGYKLNYPVHAWGLIGLEIVAYDAMNGSTNKTGISLLECRLDGKEIFIHDIQKLSFNDNPYINAHVEYTVLNEQGNYFQRCYVVDGNKLNTYCPSDLGGRIFINDTAMHHVEITLYDAYRNKCVFTFKIKGTPNQKPSAPPVAANKKNKKKAPLPPISSYDFENVLKVTIRGQEEKNATLFIKNTKITLPPAYTKGSENVYLWDLRKALPDSIQVGKLCRRFTFSQILPSANANIYSHPYMDILFQKNALLDTIYLAVGFREGVYSIHDHRTPLVSPIQVTLKPNMDILNKEKIAVYNYTPKGSLRYIGGEWRGNTIKFKTKILGDFVLSEDVVPPKIRYLKKVGNVLYFHLSDNLSGIAHWYAYLNGSFLLMHYDPKFNVIYTHTQQPDEIISGTLLIGAIDNSGNLTQTFFKY